MTLASIDHLRHVRIDPRDWEIYRELPDSDKHKLRTLLARGTAVEEIAERSGLPIGVIIVTRQRALRAAKRQNKAMRKLQDAAQLERGNADAART